MNTIEAQYIESGTFVAGEEEVFNAGIERGETVVVMRRADFDAMKEDAWRYRELCK